MPVNALSAATLAIYILLLQPTLYILYRHGWPGFLGWFYLQLFCIVRIIGNAMSLHTALDSSGSSSKSTMIVNSIGLSPLLLATAGILHEARRARASKVRVNAKWEWAAVIQYHFLVSGALGLIVAGVAFLESATRDGLDTASPLIKAGAAILVLCWLLLVVWTVTSFMGARRKGGELAEPLDWASGSRLLIATAIALPMIALRLVYSVASLLLDVAGHASDIFTTSLAVKVCLGTVPEMVLVLVFIVAGVATSDIGGAFWSRRNMRMGKRSEKAGSV